MGDNNLDIEWQLLGLRCVGLKLAIPSRKLNKLVRAIETGIMFSRYCNCKRAKRYIRFACHQMWLTIIEISILIVCNPFSHSINQMNNNMEIRIKDVFLRTLQEFERQTLGQAVGYMLNYSVLLNKTNNKRKLYIRLTVSQLRNVMYGKGSWPTKGKMCDKMINLECVSGCCSVSRSNTKVLGLVFNSHLLLFFSLLEMS